MNFKNLSIVSVFWTLIEQLGGQLIASVFSIFVARFLGPKTYGEFSAITIFFMFPSLLGTLGLEKVIIQRKNLSKYLISNSLIYVLGSSILIAVLSLFVFSVLFPGGNVRIAFIISIGSIFSNLQLFYTSLLRRNLDVKRLAKKSALVSFFAGITGLLMSICGFGIYSLAMQSLINNIAAFLIGFFSFPAKIDFGAFSFSLILHLIAKGRAISADLFLGLYNKQSLKIFTGLLMGDYELGLITGAQRIVDIAVSLLGTTMSRSFLPIFSAAQRKRLDISQLYFKIVKYSYSIIFLALIWFGCAMPYVMQIVLGERWIEISPLIPILALSGIVSCLNFLNGSALLSLSLQNKRLKLTAFRSLCGTSLLILFSSFGPLLMCFSLFIRGLIVEPIQLRLLLISIKSNLREYLIKAASTFKIASLTIIALILLFYLSDTSITLASKTFAALALPPLIYLSFQLIFDKKLILEYYELYRGLKPFS